MMNKEDIADNLLRQWRTCQKKRSDALAARRKAEADEKFAYEWERDLLLCYAKEEIQMPDEVLEDLRA